MELRQLAHGSHGVVTRPEIVAAGITRHEIESRIRAGSLIRVHRGVFRVGHTAPSLEARYLAAVKACGPRSVLAGRAAGHLLGLLRRPPSLPEVLTPSQRRPRGVIARRATQNRSHRRHDLARRSRDDSSPHPRRSCGGGLRVGPGSRCSRGGRPISDRPGSDRDRAGASPQLARRPGATACHLGRGPDNPEPPRVALSRSAQRGRPSPARVEPADRRPIRRLPVAATPPRRRARRLSLSPHAPLLGAGP
jgi:hypothetical protein